MTPDDLLDPLLALAGAGQERVGPDELAALAPLVTTNALEEFILHPTRVPGFADDRERQPDYFEIHDRDWWIDARRPTARAYLLNLLSAAAIGDALSLSHSLWWLTQVLPETALLRSVTPTAEGLILTFVRLPAHPVPDHLVDDIHPDDYTGFQTALAAAPPSVPLPAGGSLRFQDGSGGG